MPKRKRTYGKRSRKRSFRKRKFYRRKRLVSNYVPSGIPLTRISKLRYCEEINVSSTLGVLTGYAYRANSVYDPNKSGTGHKCLAFAEWNNLFNHWKVLGSRITVSIVQNTSNTSPMVMGLYLTDGDTIPYTSSTEFIEARKGTYTMLTPGQTRVGKVTSKFSAKKFFNVVDVKDNQNLGASGNNNPAEEAFYFLWVQTTDGSTGSVDCVVTIDYITAWSEPKDLIGT